MGTPNNAGSVLIRQDWTDAVIVDSEKESYFGPYLKGTSKQSKMNSAPIVLQAKEKKPNDGHITNFEGVGSLTDSTLNADATAAGKGEKRRAFSSRLIAGWHRKVTQTDTKYARRNIGLENYLDEKGLKTELTDFYARWYDQYIFDCLQGVAARTTSPTAESRATHVLRYPYESSSPKFGYDEFQMVQRAISEGTGFEFAPKDRRNPLPKAKMVNGNKMWFLLIDPAIRDIINRDSTWREVLRQADVRGTENQLIAPVFTAMNSIAIVEMPRYFGSTSNNTPIAPNAFTKQGAANGTSNGLQRHEVGVHNCGMRQYDNNNRWTGQSGFDSTGELWSRAVLVGMHAVQVGYSMRPNITVDMNRGDDTTNLVLHTFVGAQKTKWSPEARGDYDDGAVTNIDYSAIAVDIQVGA